VAREARSAAAVILTVVGLAASGCGDGEPPPPAQEAGSTAESNTRIELSASTERVLSQLSDELAAVQDQAPRRVADEFARLEKMLDDAARSGSVSPAEMFRLQTLMTTVSQYLEAASNVMSTMHQAAMSLARAVKGS
jgi:hypothetical protein